MATNDTTYSFLTEPKDPNELGMLGPYRVIDELGRGGMGFVFRAEDTRLRRSVALKVMNEKIAATKHSRTRFISEARAMAAVDHDNVATIFEVGEKNGTPFMAMEMLQGETLEAYKTKKQRPGFEEVIEIATQIARGLSAAHAKGIVHRDIKPANIWIESGSGRVKNTRFRARPCSDAGGPTLGTRKRGRDARLPVSGTGREASRWMTAVTCTALVSFCTNCARRVFRCKQKRSPAS